MDKTTITVSDEVWRYLNQRKDRGESFDDVLRDQLGITQNDTPAPEAQNNPSAEPEPEPVNPYEDLEFPQGRDRDACIKAIDAAADYLQEQQNASMREIVAAVMPEHDLGYDVPELESGKRYRGAWWRKVVKPGLEASPRAEPPSGGYREWRWKQDQEGR